MKPSGMGVRILVKDFSRMFDFYKDIMGYDVFWGDRNTSYASFAVPGETKPTFSIQQKEGYSEYKGYEDIGEQIKSDYIVLCLVQDDIDNYYDYLKEKGIEFIGKPRDISDWYHRCVFFRDPEGNLIHIAGPMKDNKS